ncbi:hypothetical protein GCM10027174_09250 [Salinifilum aidingensis]
MAGQRAISSRSTVPIRVSVRAEPGFLWFTWSRSIEDPTEYALLESYRDQQAGVEHVQSAHFRAAQRALPPYLAETPRVVNTAVDQDDWPPLGEMSVQDHA